MSSFFRDQVGQAISDPNFIEEETIQSLWSGYGRIIRVRSILDDQTLIVKHIKFPTSLDHPRGWNTSYSHQRKVKSYEVELEWYRSYTSVDSAKFPKCYGTFSQGDEHLLILEDLNESGYSIRRSHPSQKEINACITWLANFHAKHLGQSPKGIWPIGSYWHLATRPDEFKAMASGQLKNAASAIDNQLNNCQFKTIIHGDAKVANFCFKEDATVAAVDFQYVGGGCGMKDLAYLLSSCLNENECESQESTLLDFYFSALRNEVSRLKSDVDLNALEAEWRALYPFAWADFVRFLEGWMPGHYKLHVYSKKLTSRVIDSFE